MKTPSPAEAFIAHTSHALCSGNFIRLLLSNPVKQIQPVQRVIGRLVEIKQRPMLSLTLREEKRDTTRNLSLDESPAWLLEEISGEFRSAVLETSDITWQFVLSPKGKARLVSHKSPVPVTSPKRHDRRKPSSLDESAFPWLTALGLCDHSGAVRPSAADKYRQLERYLEIFSHLVRDCGWQPGSPIRIVDMGCGKGYLTFGVWQLLNRKLGLDATVTGIEKRQHLVEKSNAIARSIAATSLNFITGDIASVDLDDIEGLIALHACDTATDQAIARGVKHGAKLILVSPCCHQELRPQLGCPPPFEPLLSHGILTERFSEWLTDGLRALRLEQAGYATKIIEFVSSEHTPRNLLIAGTKKSRTGGAAGSSAQIDALKELFRLGHIASDDIASI